MSKFLDVFEDVTKKGKKIPTDEYLPTGRFPIIDQGQAQISGYCDNKSGIFDDVPALIFGDHTRVIKYIDEPFFLGADGVKLLKAKDKSSDYKYLYYALCSAKIPNTGYNRHFKWLKETEIPVPSLEIQHQIAETLDKATHLIDLCNRILDRLDLLVKAQFVEMFGDPSVNEKSYPIKPLSEIAEYWNGLTYKPADVSEVGTIVLRSSNIQNSRLDFNDIVRVSCKIGDKKYVQKNDILMCSRNGSAKLVGKVALIGEISEPMSFGAFMMIIRSKYFPYLMTYFQLPAFRTQIITGATTTINQITGNMLNKVMLPVPDTNTVNQFDTFVKQSDKSKSAVKKVLDKAEMLKKALMQQYFG